MQLPHLASRGYANGDELRLLGYWSLVSGDGSKIRQNSAEFNLCLYEILLKS